MATSKIYYLSCLFLLLGLLQLHGQHNNEFYNKGGDIHIQAGAQVYVLGDVHMDNGTIDNDGLLQLQGDWYLSNASSTQSGSGVVRFQNDLVNLSDSQKIECLNGANLINNAAFYDLEVNNQSNQKLLYLKGGDVEVKNSIHFVNASRIRTASTSGSLGKNYAHFIYCSNNNPSALVNWGTAGDTSQYIEGRLRLAAISPNTYNFGVGISPQAPVAGSNQLAQLSVASGSGIIEASFSRDANGTIPNIQDCFLWYNCVVDHGYWSLNLISGSILDYDLILWPENANALCDSTSNDFAIVNRINGGNLFNFQFGGDPCGNSNVFGPVPRTGYSGFSEFAIAQRNPVLANDLTELTVVKIDRNVLLAWRFHKTVNLVMYELQRKSIGEGFRTIANFLSSEESEEINLKEYQDIHVTPGQEYQYRLRGLGISGNYFSSNLVNATIPLDCFSFQFYPNPANERITLSINDPIFKTGTFSLLDLTGKRWRFLENPCNGCDIDIRSVPVGFYLLEYISSNGFRYTQELIIAR